MSFVSTLTWTCMQLQGLLESSDVSEDDKTALILKHLKETEESGNREIFPEFEAGWEWFNTSRSLSVNKDFQDQIVVIDFFTYCCINCMHILPDLHELEEKYPCEKSGVVVVGVHSAKFENEKVSSNIMSAVQRYGISHPVVNDSEAVLWKKLEITCWPTLIILGPNAKPLFVIIGEGHKDVLFRYIKCCLDFYSSRLQPKKLPLILNSSETFQSHLLYPGKVCMVQIPATAEIASVLEPNQTYLAISDSGHHRIVIISLQGDIKLEIGGSLPGFENGSFESAKFHSPQGMAFLPPFSLYIADTGNHSIRLVDLRAKNVLTVAGTGKQGTDKEGGNLGLEQALASPWDLCLIQSQDMAGGPDLLIIANAGSHQIWGLALQDVTWWKKQVIEAGRCVRLAGSGAEENRNNSYPAKAAFAQPSGICSALLASSDQLLFIADSESSSIRQLSLKDGSVKALVGGDRDPSNLFCFGDKDNASDPKMPILLQHPLGVAWNPLNNLLYVADSYNHKIKTVNPVTKVCKTLLGNGKAGLVDGTLNEIEIQFNEPGGVCMDVIGNVLYVADTNNHRIRKVNLETNSVETVKVNSSKVSKLPEELTRSDYEVAASLSLNNSIVKWQVTFVCPSGWKWTDDAPQSWLIISPENIQKKGKIQQGFMSIDFEPSSLFKENSSLASLQCKADLYICAISSGVCTKKSVIVKLNLEIKSTEENKVLKHELVIVHN